jgi:hypothetical protein
VLQQPGATGLLPSLLSSIGLSSADAAAAMAGVARAGGGMSALELLQMIQKSCKLRTT